KNGLTPDAKISPYIYGDWIQGPYINQITFKELLTHTSGFGQLNNNACASGTTYSALKGFVMGGVQSGNIGVAQYGNCNFSLLRELMPALLKKSVGSGSDTQRAQNSMIIYINYMNQMVFTPVGIPPSSCTPPPLHTMQILSYPFLPASTSGINWGDETAADTCGPGGWNLTANNVFAVINDLATGNVLLTNNEKQLMTTYHLGWDNAVRGDCPNTNLCKNGDYPSFGPGISVWAYVGIFKSQI